MTTINNKIIGNSKAAVELKKMVGLISSSDAPVIIKGPTGSGKELVAEAIHQESRRKGNFVAINCAAIPSELMEAEVFGFEKGAFTGALKTTIGKFEQAHKGTLFLDEIGDMPFGLQTKLLRVLENSIIQRVGSNKEIRLDVRIVCATHKNLEKLVDKNDFREDLLFRLNVFPISVPTLHERIEDIPVLVEHFFELKTKLGNLKRPKFGESAYQALMNYKWPGNIREVRNVIERALIFFPSQQITGEDVNQYLLSVSNKVINRTEEQTAIWSEFDALGANNQNDFMSDIDTTPPKPEQFANWFDTNNSVDLRSLLRDIEIVFIEAALARNDGNTSEAAKDLKLLRTTLIEKVKKYGL